MVAVKAPNLLLPEDARAKVSSLASTSGP